MNLNPFKRKLVEVLRWSEQYTKTDMVYVFRSGGWLALQQVLDKSAGLITLIAFANLVPKDTYGSYKYLVSLAGVISMFTLTGIGTAVKQAVARGYEGNLRRGFFRKLKWSTAMAVVGTGCGVYYFVNGNVVFGYACFLIALTYPLRRSAVLFRSYLDGKKEFKTRSLYMTGWELSQAVVLIPTLFLTDQLAVILTVFFVLNALIPLVLYFRTLRLYNPSDRVDPDMRSYEIHLSVIRCIRKASKHLDKVLVFQFLGPVQLAIYTFSTLPIKKGSHLLNIFRRIAFPKFSESEAEVLKATLPRKVGIFFGGCVVTVLLFVAAVPFLYELVFPEYVVAVPYARMFSLVFLLFPAMLFEEALKAQVKEYALYKLSIISNAFKLLGLVVLLPVHGIWGGIMALILAKLVKAALSTVYFSRM